MKKRENTIKTSSLAMENFSECRREAEKVLEYSLHLGTALHPDKREGFSNLNKDFSAYLESLSDKIWEDCHTFVNGGNFNFFGYKTDTEEDLSMLWYHPPFWKHILKQDAVLFAFTTLRKIIGESHVMSPYERIVIGNSTIKEEEMIDIYHHGFDFLTTRKGISTGCPWITLDVDCNNNIPTILKNKSEYKHLSDDLLNEPLLHNSQNYIRRIQTLNRNLKNAQISIAPLFLTSEIYSDIEPEFLLSLLEFYDFTVARSSGNNNINTSILPIIEGHTIGKSFLPNKCVKYIDCVNKLLIPIELYEIKEVRKEKENSEIKENKEVKKDKKDSEIKGVFATYDGKFYNYSDIKHYLTLSDKIYLRYQIEKVFAPNTINCLYQNVVHTKNTTYALNDQPSANALAACLRLPNVFTRQYILQMAVDTISKHFDYNFRNTNFFTSKKLNSNIGMIQSERLFLNKPQKLINWNNQYSNAINYLEKILFPVYENYFFCALWNAIDEIHRDEKYTDAQILIEMYKLLQKYLNNPENVKKLFATDDIVTKNFNDSDKAETFQRKNIIHPIFKIGLVDDNSLYKTCLIAHNLTYKDGIIPDFINRSHLLFLSSNLPQLFMEKLDEGKKDILQSAIREIDEKAKNILQLNANKLNKTDEDVLRPFINKLDEDGQNALYLILKKIEKSFQSAAIGLSTTIKAALQLAVDKLDKAEKTTLQFIANKFDRTGENILLLAMNKLEDARDNALQLAMNKLEDSQKKLNANFNSILQNIEKKLKENGKNDLIAIIKQLNDAKKHTLQLVSKNLDAIAKDILQSAINELYNTGKNTLSSAMEEFIKEAKKEYKKFQTPYILESTTLI